MFKLVSKKDAKRNAFAPGVVNYDYWESSQHDFSVVELTGRYPERGDVINEKATGLVYVIAGAGCIVINGEAYAVADGDFFVIPPGAAHHWEGNMQLSIVCTPPWTKEHHKMVEDVERG